MMAFHSRFRIVVTLPLRIGINQLITPVSSSLHNSFVRATIPNNPLWTSSTLDCKAKDEKDPVSSDKKEERHRDAEKDPLPEWPDGVNPHTGERGGPKGPEPTRFGDWERKGRVTDF